MRRLVALAALVALLLAAVGARLLRSAQSCGCEQSYMYPSYVEVPVPAAPWGPRHRYRLLLYREGGGGDAAQALPPSGMPALLVPGNAGSYEQVRSLASETARMAAAAAATAARRATEAAAAGERSSTREGLPTPPPPTLQPRVPVDWYALDLRGELSAFDGALLHEQAAFAAAALRQLAAMYVKGGGGTNGSSSSGVDLTALPANLRPAQQQAAGVLLFGHSMGGVVARAAAAAVPAGTVAMLMTLASPHAAPPLALQPAVARFYGGALARPLPDGLPVVSLHGGNADVQVAAALTRLPGVGAARRAALRRRRREGGGGGDAAAAAATSRLLWQATSAVPGVWTDAGHTQIDWCNQLVRRLAAATLEVAQQHAEATANAPTNTTATTTTSAAEMLAGFLEGGAAAALDVSGASLKPPLALALPDNAPRDVALAGRGMRRCSGAAPDPAAHEAAGGVVVHVDDAVGGGGAGGGAVGATLIATPAARAAGAAAGARRGVMHTVAVPAEADVFVLVASGAAPCDGFRVWQQQQQRDGGASSWQDATAAAAPAPLPVLGDALAPRVREPERWLEVMGGRIDALAPGGWLVVLRRGSGLPPSGAARVAVWLDDAAAPGADGSADSSARGLPAAARLTGQSLRWPPPRARLGPLAVLRSQRLAVGGAMLLRVAPWPSWFVSRLALHVARTAGEGISNGSCWQPVVLYNSNIALTGRAVVVNATLAARWRLDGGDGQGGSPAGWLWQQLQQQLLLPWLRSRRRTSSVPAVASATRTAAPLADAAAAAAAAAAAGVGGPLLEGEGPLWLLRDPGCGHAAGLTWDAVGAAARLLLAHGSAAAGLAVAALLLVLSHQMSCAVRVVSAARYGDPATVGARSKQGGVAGARPALKVMLPLAAMQRLRRQFSGTLGGAPPPLAAQLRSAAAAADVPKADARWRAPRPGVSVTASLEAVTGDPRVLLLAACAAFVSCWLSRVLDADASGAGPLLPRRLLGLALGLAGLRPRSAVASPGVAGAALLLAVALAALLGCVGLTVAAKRAVDAAAAAVSRFNASLAPDAATLAALAAARGGDSSGAGPGAAPVPQRPPCGCQLCLAGQAACGVAVGSLTRAAAGCCGPPSASSALAAAVEPQQSSTAVAQRAPQVALASRASGSSADGSGSPTRSALARRSVELRVLLPPGSPQRRSQAGAAPAASGAPSAGQPLAASPGAATVAAADEMPAQQLPWFRRRRCQLQLASLLALSAANLALGLAGAELLLLLTWHLPPRAPRLPASRAPTPAQAAQGAADNRSPDPVRAAAKLSLLGGARSRDHSDDGGGSSSSRAGDANDDDGGGGAPLLLQPLAKLGTISGLIGEEARREAAAAAAGADGSSIAAPAAADDGDERRRRATGRTTALVAVSPAHDAPAARSLALHQLTCHMLHAWLLLYGTCLLLLAPSLLAWAQLPLGHQRPSHPLDLLLLLPVLAHAVAVRAGALETIVGRSPAALAGAAAATAVGAASSPPPTAHLSGGGGCAGGGGDVHKLAVRAAAGYMAVAALTGHTPRWLLVVACVAALMLAGDGAPRAWQAVCAAAGRLIHRMPFAFDGASAALAVESGGKKKRKGT